MGKFRPRIKGKGKRWAKGHSSSSNPETKKFRDVAKSRFFQENLGLGGLTVEAVKKHDAFQGTSGEIDIKNEECDVRTMGTYKTMQTFASNWTDCTNLSFNKFLTSFSSTSALHKEMLAVLAAVTEVIKANGGQETTTEYFAALMTTLEVTETEDSIGAVLAVLRMGMRHVPENVLKSKFSDTSKTFMNLLSKFVESDSNVILKSLIGCISVLLGTQEHAVWNNPSTLQIFDSILMFTIHPKPKVRKVAQNSVNMILRNSVCMYSDNPPPYHPAAPHTAEFCKRQIEEGAGGTSTLHTLTLLEKVIPTFPKSNLKAVCESILKVMTQGNVLVTTWSLHVFHSLFSANPSVTYLPPVLNGQIISALYDYQPSINDTQPMLAWLSVLLQAHINLAVNKSALFYDILPRLFTAMLNLWQRSDNTHILTEVTKVLEGVVKQTTDFKAPSSYFVLEKVFHQIEDCLKKYEYRTAEMYVLHMLAVFFEVADNSHSKFMISCLKYLAERRDTYNFTHAKELEYAVGRAVRSMGPEIVLSAIPLDFIDEQLGYHLKRSWLLPVLHENICSSTLKFFIEYFLPLATKCRHLSIAFTQKNNGVAAHSFDLLQNQIWSLLPLFCNNPPDVTDNFKTIAKCLGTAIAEHKDLRAFVMSALKKLISSCKENGQIDSVNEVARFAKNYLPILFNLYTTKPVGSVEEGHRLAAYETIKVYLSIADKQLCKELFDKAYEKLGEKEVDNFVKESVLDLLRALLPYQNEDKLVILLTLCNEGLKNPKDRRAQKKTYRLLEHLCSSDSENCNSFITKNLAKVQEMILETASHTAIPSKGPRLLCIISIIQKLEEPSPNLLKHIVPETVLACKDVNERCRAAAFNLLEEIGMAMKRWSPEKSDVDVMRDYIGLLLAGLTGTPKVVSCTILALAKLTYYFRDVLPQDILHLLLENVILLIISTTREIVGSCLSFLKVFISSFTPPVVAPFIPNLIKGLVNMTEDCKRHFRVKTSRIFDRLIRKFGYEDIVALVPKSDAITRKRLNNMRKIQARNKREREERDKYHKEKEEEEDSLIIKGKHKSIEDILAESDDSDLETDDRKSRSQNKKQKTKLKTWIQESPDTITDFTDVKVTEKISVTNPASFKNMGKNKALNRGFKTASDGRLIIMDESDDNDDENIASSRSHASYAGSDEEESPKNNYGSSGRKRKISTSTTVNESEPPPKYQAGGSGIHRPLKQRKQGKKNKSAVTPTYGSEYRAKKAKGDMKLRGKPDPYAYIPLSRKSLNRRKKAKAAGQFRNLVGAARKGAQKGSRQRAKAMKKNK